MTQTITADNVEQLIHCNDTIEYPLTGGHTGRGTVKEIELIGSFVALVVLPIGADHTVKIATADVTVVHPAMDLPALTAHLGLPAHEQSAVQAFTGDPYGHMWSLTEAAAVAKAWDFDTDADREV